MQGGQGEGVGGDKADAPEGCPEHRDGHGANGGELHLALSIRVERIGTMTHTVM
jgi:hypothetical protein